MPRRSRLVLSNVPLHIIQRGNNRQACFLSESDYLVYLEWLAEHAGASHCRIHAYVLMSNHVHLLISAHEAGAPGILMKALGQHHAQYMNWRYRRSGSLWDGRYKACLIQDERYLLVCQRYIELNPVRARMVDFPAQYRWSSYRCNAEGKADRLICPHPAYLELGADAAARRQAYRDLFRHALAPDLLDYIRASANGNAGLSGQEFLRWAAGKKTKPEA